MRGLTASGDDVRSTADDQFRVTAPQISLPKGGGAIRGIGEKLAVSPVTGTGSLSIPIATSPGRAGFGPQLTLSYDSGAGNGPFGIGWSLSMPAITRKTDKGLPRYADSDEADSDVFLLSGAEDLVPELGPDGRRWTKHIDGFTVHRYRPRVEGLFARIERWTDQATRDVHWRSISRDNILTVYGRDERSRIADPDDGARVFSWLICETRDDRGQAVLYFYQREDGAGVDLTQAHERNRGDRDSTLRRANLYLKRVRYGNRQTLLDEEDRRPRFLAAADIDATEWMFEAVFDYGDHDEAVPRPEPDTTWICRSDPFSSYRAGFDVRTYRLCRRVLMFHHFPGQAGVEKDCLVGSTDFLYSQREDAPDHAQPAYTFLTRVLHKGYQRSGTGYLSSSLPPLDFEYSRPHIDETIRDVAGADAASLPFGVEANRFQWVDLDGEGLPGILTEQGGAWFYQRNLSQLAAPDAAGAPAAARLAPMGVLTRLPSFTGLATGRQQLMDLAGDGQLDLAQLAGPTPGFFERTENDDWSPFRAFPSRPTLDWGDPRLRLIDLTGDGHPDVLLSEDEAFCWHASLAEDGFGPAHRVQKALDEEQGPRLLFAGPVESIFLADLSGDGLTDLVRIRNGEVCYWPNLGYGRFGAKVTMDQAPWFDADDLFDSQRIRLADIDGSGTTDILYPGRDGVQVYFNQSGNAWSTVRRLKVFPAWDSSAAVTALDLLGNGTACLVWSSPLGRPLRYVDLMSGRKPHLLTTIRNNLGAETTIEYAPSTRFYLQDRLEGAPWVTRLPFPVHCVTKVTVIDKWRKTRFSSTYSYHHGYFDGLEREFRGFGRVEQVDVESFGEFAQGNAASPFITADKTLYQPPVKTVTWYHTGASVERDRVLATFEREYFPASFEARRPETVDVLGDFQENVLPEPDLLPAALDAREWREALRACKGMMLRQEQYELDVDALDAGRHVVVKLFAATSNSCHIRCLQRRASNLHAVFLVTASEAITYHYELDLTPQQVRPDPRITHALNLRFDEYGHVLQAVTIVYPRRGRFADDSLPADAVALVRAVQQERHAAYAETRFTNDPDLGADDYRVRVPYEILTYALTGLTPRDDRYFTLGELTALRLSEVHQESGTAVPEIPYHKVAHGNAPQKRLVEHQRTLFVNDEIPALDQPAAFRTLPRLGLQLETYKLALTEDLLAAVFGSKLTPDVRATLSDAAVSGYLSGAALAARFAGEATAGQHWLRSGIAGFAADASRHFYLPERYIDPFGNVTTLEFDNRDLFVAASTDARGNTTRVLAFDFRVLAPTAMQDPNDNLSEVSFDILGFPAAMAVKGKGNEADDLAGLTAALANPPEAERADFFTRPDLDEARARIWLGTATARYVYHFGQTTDASGVTIWGAHPACACVILRERHVRQLGAGEQSPLQIAFEYSDGTGGVLVTKKQAEPELAGQPLRWTANGKSVLNNKGNVVKRYEPYFSAPQVGHRFEEPREEGVPSILYYDAVGRTVRVEMPDGSYSRVEFSPWHVRTFDQNDTVQEPGNAWLARRTADTATPEEKRAARLASEHADTPAVTLLDSLGREVISLAHNRVENDAGELEDEKYLTFTRLDAEGKPLWIRDARGNLVMQYITPPVASSQASDPVDFVPTYDLAGNLLFQHGMDAGDRWLLGDADGKAMFAWDSRGHVLRTEYDGLHRPVATFVKGADPSDANREIQLEKVIYGDTPGNGLTEARRAQLNLRGKPYKHHDTAGLVTTLGRNPATGSDEAFDFKGNLLRSTRRLLADHKRIPDWSQNPALATETFTSSTRYDAINRPIQLIAPHSDQPGAELNIIRTAYNQAQLLERVDVWLEQAEEPNALLDPSTASLNAVASIDYNAKGQRTRIEYNDASHRIVTQYSYDKETFRLLNLLSTRPSHPETNSRKLQDLSFTYDPVGNTTSIRDDAQQTVFFDNTAVAAGNAYVYDALYRLIHAEGREHAAQNNTQRDASSFEPILGIPFPNSPEALQRYTEDYEYDAVGNITVVRHTGGSVQRWVRRHQYALDSNRLLATRLPGDPDNLPVYTVTPGYSARYSYDQHGSMTSMPHLPVMEWDFMDQLRATQQQVDNGGSGEKTWYVYDANGQRVRKVTETQNGTPKDERIYLGGYELYRKYGADGATVTLERETLHVMDDKKRVALIETRTRPQGDDSASRQLVRFQLGNHLRSAVLELDGEARVISYEEYHPYGSTAYQSGRSTTQTPKRYRYTDKERDEETGFYYHGARYYAPWLARWITVDPSGLADDVNLFAYVRNNPTRFHDPTGRDANSQDRGFFSGFGKRLWDRATAPTEAQKAFKEKRYGDFAKHVVIDAALASNPVVGMTVSDFHLARAAAAMPGQVWDAATTPRNDEAGSKMADAVLTGAALALRVAGPKAKGIFRKPASPTSAARPAASATSPATSKASPPVTPEPAPPPPEPATPPGAAPAESAPAKPAPAEPAPVDPTPAEPAKSAPPKPAVPEPAQTPNPAQGTLVGTSEAGFRRAAAKHIRNTPNHPLRFLLDANSNFKSTRGLKHSELANRPDLVQMGHIVSKKAGGQRVVLQGAWENQLNNVTAEHPGPGGARQSVHIQNEAIDIGGVGVEAETAKLWEREGLIPSGTVANAPRVY